MLTRELRDSLNQQMNEENYASTFYLAVSAYLESQDLRGMAAWSRSQSEHERQHLMQFYQYLIDRGERAIPGKVPAPPSEWSSAYDAFEHAYQHEQKLTKHFTALLDLAEDHRDQATRNFLQGFIDSQSEEEATLRKMLAQLRLAGDNPSALLLVDREIGHQA